MIVGSLFLILFCTKFSDATLIKTEVKYGKPNKITIPEYNSNGKIFLPGLLPYRQNLIHQGSNFFFNPQLNLPSAMFPPVVETMFPQKKNCETINIVNKPEIDIIAQEKPVEFLTLPEVPVVVNEIIEPMPLQVENKIDGLPIIPEAPELPNFVYPESPLPVFPQALIPALTEEVIPQAPIITEQLVKLPNIPAAPELPPFVMPELPLPSFPEVSIPVMAGVDPIVIEELEKLPNIPAAPELPPFVMPGLSIPNVPQALTPVLPEKVILHATVVTEKPAKLPLIPAAPQLPPFVEPELPLPIVPQVSIPVLPEVTNPAAPLIIEESVKISEIPPPPVLPPLMIAAIPKPILEEDKKKVILVPAAPDLPALLPSQQVVGAESPMLATTCAHNIVLQRALPHIVNEQLQRIELIPFPAANFASCFCNK